MNYPAKLTSGYYRVRESWDEPAGQVGAYRLLANAKAKCDEHPGTYVFDNDGNPIYPEESGLEEEEVITPETKEPTEDEVVEPAPVEPEPVEPPVEETPADEGEDKPSEDEQKPAEKEDPPVTEEFPPAEEGGEVSETVAYAKLKTLMNIRAGASLEDYIITTYKKNTIVDVLEVLDNGWLKIKCAESSTGIAYVSNENDAYAFIGSNLYTVVSRDNLWKIAEQQLGKGTRYTEIRALNGLTSNAIRVGMKLIMP